MLPRQSTSILVETPHFREIEGEAFDRTNASNCLGRHHTGRVVGFVHENVAIFRIDEPGNLGSIGGSCFHLLLASGRLSDGDDSSITNAGVRRRKRLRTSLVSPRVCSAVA